MNYEKLYKEARERAKKVLNEKATDREPGTRISEYIFPELKRNEDDRIRGMIINTLNRDKILTEDEAYDCVSWLEKMSEQKPINNTNEEIVEAVKDTSVLDMVESKLKAGQWIIDTQDGEILHINKVLEHAYEVTNLKGGSYEVSRCCIETWNKPWTIQDAEDGDVLFSPSHNLLWLHKDEEQCHACINLNYNDSISIGTDFVTPSDVSPAIKEQRDLLFRKMKEAGYEWDAEKKELNEIESNKHIKYEPNSPSIIEENWSEEDDKMLIDAIGAVGAADYYTYDDKQEIENWLKSLKEKLHPQWKPSEEQIQALEYQVHSTYKGSWQYRASNELLEQLKKLYYENLKKI